MPVDPFTAWLVTQALGPELISRGLDSLSKRSWREKLVKSIVELSSEKVSRRRLLKWLDAPSTWDDLVAMNAESIERLKTSLVTALRPKIVIRTKRYQPQQLRQQADHIVPIAVGEFLVTLDPSRATAVANYREMAELRSIRGQLDHVIEGMNVDRDLPELLKRLPPTAKPPVEDLFRSSRTACSTLLKAVLGDSEGPAAASLHLVQTPPDWMSSASASAWLALGEIASGHGEHQAASRAFEQAAQSGAPDRAIHLARAALEAGSHGDIGEARRLIAESEAVSGGSDFLRLARAVVDHDFDEAVRAAVDYSPNAPHSYLVCGYQGNVHFIRGEYDLAIAAYEEQMRREPRAAGAALQAANSLLARATKGKSPSWQSDVRRARELALKARDLRREWMGPSEEAVVLACQAAISAHAWDKAIALGLPAPEGEATEREAASQDVLGAVASASIPANRFDILERMIELLTDPFERAFHTIHLHEKQGRPFNDLILEYQECWALATELDQKFSVQLGLASLGHWPIPGFDELERDLPEEADSVAALSESVRGSYDTAIPRLRKWPSSPRAQQLLVNLLQEEGNFDEAVKVARDCHARFDDPLFGIMAARVLAKKGDLGAADKEARESLVDVAEGSEAGIELTYLLIEFAAERGDWTEIESLSRRLSTTDPGDSKARWWWLLALFNQGRVDDAWRVLNQPERLWPSDDLQARLWLELHRRFGEGAQVIQDALELAGEYEDSEEIRASALFLAYETSRDEDLPESTVRQVQSATEAFLDQFPESTLFRKITFADIEDLIGQMQEFLEPGAKQYEDLRKSILLRWFPYAVLPALLNRSYAEALLMRAAGALTQEVQEDQVRDVESSTVASAGNGDVVVDTSVLTTLAIIPDLRDSLLAAFSGVFLTMAANRDIQQARARLAVRSTASMGWDVAEGRPLTSEISQELADQLADQAEWVAQTATQLKLVDVSELSLFPELDADGWSAALSAVQLAKDRGIPLFSADAGLRLLARAFDVQAFGLLAFIDYAQQQGLFAGGDETIRSLRRHYVVDLPTTKDDVISQAEDDEWAVGPASYVLTRGAFWRDPRVALDTFKAACFMVASKNPDALPGWVGSAIYGAAWGRDAMSTTAVTAPLVVYAVLASQFDIEALPALLRAARRATSDLGASDPLPAVVEQISEAFREHFHPHIAAQLVVNVIQRLEPADREAALEVILKLRS